MAVKLVLSTTEFVQRISANSLMSTQDTGGGVPGGAIDTVENFVLQTLPSNWTNVSELSFHADTLQDSS
jgi:hypothetical protein